MPELLRLIVLLLVGVAAVGCDRQKQEAPQAPTAQAVPVKGVDRSHRGETAPASAFVTPDGDATTLAAFAGKPLLVNLWATWCAPCVKELPTLDALERQGALAVIAISQDDSDQATVESFLRTKKIGRFAAYHDQDMALMSALAISVLPTTILYDAAGKEVWRYTGDLDWTGPEARALLFEVSPSATR